MMIIFQALIPNNVFTDFNFRTPKPSLWCGGW